MESHESTDGSSRWGTVTVEDVAGVHLPIGDTRFDSVGGSTSRCVWTPSADLRDELPEGHQLELFCDIAGDGVRRFYFTCSVPTFAVRASVGGVGILSRRGELLDKEQLFYYRLMAFVYQLAPRLQENLKRTIRRTEDLRVPLVARSNPGDADVLPDGLGATPEDPDVKWSIRTLLQAGHESAIGAGICKPIDSRTCIRLGLLEAARLNPVDSDHLTDQEALQWVRLSLFDLGPAEETIEAEVRDTVIERLLDVLDKHWDLSTEGFNRWLYDGIDNVVHQIAKRKRGGGPITRAVVRQVILELVFESYGNIAVGLHVQMRAFAGALPKPLNKQEQAIFDATFIRQPKLGNLSLLLLHDQFDLLREIVPEVWQKSNEPRLWGILLRLIRFHAEMVHNKRESERRYKAVQNSIASPAGHTAAYDEFVGIAAEFREVRDAHCSCGTLLHWHADLEETGIDANLEEVTWIDACEDCEHIETVTVTRLEFESVARRLRE